MKWRDDLPVILSGLAGALALAVSTYNVYLQRSQVQAQVWPYLEWTYNNTDDQFSWNLANVGVGPALIKGVRVTVDGAPVRTTNEALGRLEPGLTARKGVEVAYASFSQRVLPAGLSLHPVDIKNIPGDDPFVKAQLDRLEIEICYCSTLGDCWVRSPNRGTLPLQSCPAYPGFSN